MLISAIEPAIGTPWDGVWWALVAATTVGYGDISPESFLGRILAAILTLFGIGILGVFAGLVAACFVEEEEATTHAEIARRHDRLDGSKMRSESPAAPTSRSARFWSRSVVGDPGFEWDAEAVGDPVDVGEVPGDFCDVENVDVVESGVAKCLDIGLDHVCWMQRQFDGVGQHCEALRAEASGSPVGIDASKEIVVFEEAAQTAPVVSHSVMTAIGLADNKCDELTFHFAQCLGA